jgi:hypothetical protein
MEAPVGGPRAKMGRQITESLELVDEGLATVDLASLGADEVLVKGIFIQ